MTTQLTHDLGRWKAAGSRLTDLHRAVTDMQNLPSVLAADAVENATHVLAPLRALEDVALPEQIKERARAMHGAAKALADAPSRSNAEAWVKALADLRTTMTVHGTAMHRAARSAASRKHGPPPVRKIDVGHIYGHLKS